MLPLTAGANRPLVRRRNLERALGALGLDATWVKQSEMLNTWTDLAEGRSRKAGGRRYRWRQAQPRPLAGDAPWRLGGVPGAMPWLLSNQSLLSHWACWDWVGGTLALWLSAAKRRVAVATPRQNPTGPRLACPCGGSYTDEELRATFDAIDADKSGDIDLRELTAAIKAISPATDDATVQKMLSVADQDGDGEVSFDEFRELVNNYPLA